MDVEQNNLGQPADGPDCARIDLADCRERVFPAVLGMREGVFTVVMKQSALNAIYRHGHSTPEVEVCGVMVGMLCHDNDGPFLLIEGTIEGLHAEGHASRVTFTSDTWSHFHEVLEEKYPERRIVGWYHTHPGFGVFLSGMDMFIHRNFFDLPWQTALVYDPLGGDEGMFIWREGQAARTRVLVLSDEVGAKPKIENPETRRPPEDESEMVEEAGGSLLRKLGNWLGRR